MLLDRRMKHNPLVLCCLSLVVCLSIWQLITGPGPPTYIMEIVTIVNTSNEYPMHLLPMDDYTHLMNLNDFEFTILNNACNATYPLLLILIHTDPSNHERRKVIRETWGHHVDNVIRLFVLGDIPSNDTKLRSAVDEEIATFDDFIQGNFLDTYRNVTYKHALVFKYTIYHCPSAKYLLKTDDDVFVNLPSLMDFLDNDLKSNRTKDLLFCSAIKTPSVMRSYRSKWRVSYKEYPDSYYPDMCPGWTILYSSATLFKLYSELQKAPYFWIDDVLVTGVLRKKLNISLENSSKFIVSGQNFNKDGVLVPPVKNHFFFGPPDITGTQIRSLWNYVQGKMKDSHNHGVGK